MSKMPSNPYAVMNGVQSTTTMPSPELPEFDLIEGELESGIMCTNVREFRAKQGTEE